MKFIRTTKLLEARQKTAQILFHSFKLFESISKYLKQKRNYLSFAVNIFSTTTARRSLAICEQHEFLWIFMKFMEWQRKVFPLTVFRLFRVFRVLNDQVIKSAFKFLRQSSAKKNNKMLGKCRKSNLLKRPNFSTHFAAFLLHHYTRKMEAHSIHFFFQYLWWHCNIMCINMTIRVLWSEILPFFCNYPSFMQIDCWRWILLNARESSRNFKLGGQTATTNYFSQFLSFLTQKKVNSRIYEFPLLHSVSI